MESFTAVARLQPNYTFLDNSKHDASVLHALYFFSLHISLPPFFLKECMALINLVIETDVHHASPGGTGGVKSIGNYAAGNVTATPVVKGTILPGITRKSIIDVSCSQGFEVSRKILTLIDQEGFEALYPGYRGKAKSIPCFEVVVCHKISF
ncbi:hypothetical protein Ancab_003650 [Ancistrocladus abbreviatus]